MPTTATIMTLATLGAALVIANSSCNRSSAGPAAASDAEVTTVVFIDKQKACDCTRKRADDAFANLEAALGTPPKIPVERIYIDTEKERAAPYLEMHNVMVVPGIYFLDAKGELVAMLQGEQSTEQLSAALGK